MKNLSCLLAAALTVVAAETANAEPQPLTLADPFVLSHGGKYYAYGTWSGNGIAVAVSGDLHTWKLGVAFADRPEGPWTKSAANPILRRFRGLEGTGHHSLFKDRDGKWRIVLHAHRAPGKVGPRRTYIADLAVRGTSAAPELFVGGELIACMIGE